MSSSLTCCNAHQLVVFKDAEAAKYSKRQVGELAFSRIYRVGQSDTRYSDVTQLWVPLLEKAYAWFRSPDVLDDDERSLNARRFFKIDGGTDGNALSALTGGVAHTIDLSRHESAVSEALWQQLQQYLVREPSSVQLLELLVPLCRC